MLRFIPLLFLIICSQPGKAQEKKPTPQLLIQPDSSLYHQPLHIKVQSFPANQEIKITLKAKDARGSQWKSEAIYRSNPQGIIDLSKDKSLAGSYRGIHPMGLFWSLQSPDYHQFTTNKGFWAEFEIYQQDNLLSRKKVFRESTRSLNALNINYIQKRDSIIADFYLPDTCQNCPAIIFLGGSGGGFRQERASLLASEGYAVLNLKYFRHESLPDGIVEIPLEYVHKAYQWLQQEKGVAPNKIGIMGRSRGSELAMLYAIYFSGLSYVVAEVPSSVVWFGWAENKSSWSYQGKPFPYAEYSDEASTRIELGQQQRGEQFREMPKFLSAFKDTAMIKRTRIPIEKLSCPVLFISGEDDQTWPSAMMAEMMMESLRKNNFSYPYQHFSYPEAGHNFAGGGQGCGIPYLPPEDYSQSSARGGSDKGNALAAIQSWKVILDFVQKSSQ
ncbi:MAG: acyl-CoA thioester hydrolase/BAAT C-terminal domain-containing protein [Bacteroidota bacterium]